MSRRKLPKSKLKVFRNIGVLETDYKRVLQEDKKRGIGIAVIITKALDCYFLTEQV